MSDDDTGPRKFLETHERIVYVKGPPILLDGYISLEDIFLNMFTGRHWIMTSFETFLTYVASIMISS